MNFTIEDNMGGSGDNLYNDLLDAHQGLSTEQSHRLNARLVLIFMNQVGESAAVKATIAWALQGMDTASVPEDAGSSK